MKYKFTQILEDEYDNKCAKIKMETSSDPLLPDIVENFECFLKGAGYIFPDGASLGYEYDEEFKEPSVASESECGAAERKDVEFVNAQQYLDARDIISKFNEREYATGIIEYAKLLCSLIDTHYYYMNDEFVIQLKNEIIQVARLLDIFKNG
jgi:hypothetical protein